MTGAPRRGPFSPLRNRDFRLLFGGETISMLGDQFHFVALAWLTLQLTDSGLALGTVLMVAAIPRAVFMLLGGALSDRLSPRSLMLVSNAARAVVVGILAGLVLTGNAQLWQLYLTAAIFGVVDALFYPAISTILPMLLDDDELPPANALIQGVAQFTGLIGPALAGVVIAVVQTGPAFVIDALSFGVATVAILFVVGGRRPTEVARPDAPPDGLLTTIRAGIAYTLRDPAIRSLMLVTAAINLAFAGPINVGLPYLAATRFEGGSAAFGLLLSAFGAGALGGAVAAGAISRVPRLGTTVLGVCTGLGVGMGLIGVADSLAVTLGLMLGIGLGAGFVNVHIISWLQARAADEMRGRVMSLVMLSSLGLAPVSYAAAGTIVELGAAGWMFAAAGVMVVIACLIGFATGTHRRMDAEPTAPTAQPQGVTG